MSTRTNASPSAATYNKSRLFLLSVIALVTGGMVFSIRANILGDLQRAFFEGNPLTALHAAELVGAAAGAAFLGMAIANFIGGPLCDYAGMGRLLGIASILHIVATVSIIFTAAIGAYIPVYWALWGGMLLIGLAHGFIEAVINPLTATLYPEDKTHRLNVLHAWWPGGIIIGGVIGYALAKMNVSWQIQQATILIPACVYGFMTFSTKFPPTERMAAGVSTKDMLKEVARPMFIIWWLCMFLTAASELAPGTWVDAVLSRNVGFSAIWLLIGVSGLMFVMRHFAGSLAHKLSPIGLMWFSALLAGIGLILLSRANSIPTAILGAFVWGTGVCYMWPTMLAVTSERFPRGGAFLLGLMGTAGNLAIWLVLPKMGQVFDHYKEKGAEQLGTNFTSLSQAAAANVPSAKEQLENVLSIASSKSFLYVAILPAILLVVFGIIYLIDKSKGGYKAEILCNVVDQADETPLYVEPCDK